MTITNLAVVIPARNEEGRIGRCLDAVAAAVTALTALPVPPAAVRTILVLDRCTDATAAVAAHRGVETIVSDHGRVGAARAMGVAAALTGCRPEQLWIACTDADSQVGADWLLTQWRFAQQGADLMLGTVRPDSRELPPDLTESWLDKHDLTDGHPHIHGANLGVRGDTYCRAGGFAPVPVHEDLLLVERVRALGGQVVSTAASPVLTSARLDGRTPGGLAGYLRDLLREPA